jgi:hypothetical protein
MPFHSRAHCYSSSMTIVVVVVVVGGGGGGGVDLSSSELRE